MIMENSISSVQSLSHVWLFANPWTAEHQASLSIANSQSLLKLADAIQPSHPLSSSSPPAFNLSQHQGLFQGVSSSHQVAKYWKIMWRFLKKLKIELLYDLAISLLGLYTKEMKSLYQNDICTLMIFAALFTIVNTRNNLRVLWIKKMWYIHLQ